ncbi:hypothetical protein ABXN37_28665, partial [Piscinibacter sakaiensis]|uniref:hypothetical protein n=1 Tax=Piscinibacter sakaiensis TaxID=1547922 RepID=UPI001E533718
RPLNSNVMPPSNTTEKVMQRRLRLLPTLPDPRRLQRSRGAAFSAAPSLRVGMQHAASGAPAPRVFAGVRFVPGVGALFHRPNVSIERTVNGVAGHRAAGMFGAPLSAAHVGRYAAVEHH